jgi:hypothetical protein
MESKYGTDPIVYFEVRGDEGDSYYYNIEDPEIEKQIEDLDKSLWYTVTAGGGQDGQFLKIEPATSQAGNSGGGDSRGNGGENSFSTGNIVDDFKLCLAEAFAIVRDELGIAPKSVEGAPVVQSMAATLYINWSHTRFLRPLTAADVPEREYVETEDGRSDEYAVELGELIDTLPRDSGKAHDGRALKTTIAKFREALDSPISDELFGRMKKWLNDEAESQTPIEIPEDELPF